MEGFVDYQKLPERIASVDINLAPLTDTIFNRAKSENKWVEAALVQTVTAASNLGAFAEMVQDGEDGVLCRDEAEWLEKLQWLIDDEPARKAIAGRAYGRCSRECVTIFHATGICEWVERHWNLRCAFVLPAMEISGGDVYKRQVGGFGIHYPYPDCNLLDKRDLDGHFKGFGETNTIFHLDDPERYEREEGYRHYLAFFSDNNSCIRRDIFEKYPYEDVNFAEDQIWARKMIELGFKKVYCPYAPVYHSHNFKLRTYFKRY